MVQHMIRKVGVTRLHLSLDPPFVRHVRHPIQLFPILIIITIISISIINSSTGRSITFSTHAFCISKLRFHYGLTRAKNFFRCNSHEWNFSS